MAPEISAPYPRLAKLRQVLRRIFAGIVVAFVIICLAAYAYPTILLHRELSFLRQNGQPVTSAEMLPLPIPQTQNAAPLYQRAAAVMQFKSSRDCNNLSKKKIVTILRKNAQTINLIRQATDKSQCRFTLVRDENNMLSTSPKYTKLRDLARLLALRALSEAQTGNKKEALQDVRRQFIMASHVASDPLYMSALVARVIQVTANNTLAKVLLQISITSTEAHDFEASLPQIDWPVYLHKVLLTERTLGIEEAASFHDQFGFIGYILFPFFRMDEVYSLRLWKGIIHDEENAPIPVPSDYARRLDQRIDHRPWYALFSMGLIVYDRVRLNYDYSETLRREREIALALAVYHSQYHHYPATLEPAEKRWESTFPLDIYSKKPFRYKSDGKTFLLYSVGPNGKDDGGIWKYNFKTGTTKDDLAWKNGSS